MFIGRKPELQFLETRYRSPGGQLIVLYGRRRVGKTETLREFCHGKEHVFYSCRECTDRQQLQSFSNKILRENIPASRYMKEFSDWETALKSVAELPGTEKKLLVIDEFPYMCRGNSSIPSILQNLWDEYLKDENIMIILCGSAMSFMEKKLLSEKNPLYGRATGIYKMGELPFADVAKFFPSYSDEEKITAYAILGGIPHYLKQFSPDLSLEENIRQNILTKGSILYSEIEFLLRQELRETAVYNTIIEAIALGNTTLNEIFLKTQIEKSKMSAYLKNLIDLEIVEREFLVSDGIKERANSNRGIYHLTDNFFRFWYSFVFTSYSELEDGDVEGVFEYTVKPHLHEYTSYIFEDVCREYVKALNRARKLPCRYARIGRWWGKVTKTETDEETGKSYKRTFESEIDIMAVDASGKEYLLGECKFKANPFELSDLKNLQQKYPVKQGEQAWYYLFSQGGFSERVLQLEAEQKLRCIPLSEIVRRLSEE